jgi:hypothetical protein
VSAIKCNLCNSVIYLEESSTKFIYNFKCLTDGCPVAQYLETQLNDYRKYALIIIAVAIVIFGPLVFLILTGNMR